MEILVVFMFHCMERLNYSQKPKMTSSSMKLMKVKKTPKQRKVVLLKRVHNTLVNIGKLKERMRTYEERLVRQKGEYTKFNQHYPDMSDDEDTTDEKDVITDEKDAITDEKDVITDEKDAITIITDEKDATDTSL